MTTTATGAAPQPGAGVRWALTGTRGRGPSDGTWWPRSANLDAEVTALDNAVQHILHERIARISYTKSQWPPTPRRIHTDLGITKLGWFTHARYPENINLTLTDHTRLVLTVIPPSTDVWDNEGGSTITHGTTRAQIRHRAAAACSDLDSAARLPG